MFPNNIVIDFKSIIENIYNSVPYFDYGTIREIIEIFMKYSLHPDGYYNFSTWSELDELLNNKYNMYASDDEFNDLFIILTTTVEEFIYNLLKNISNNEDYVFYQWLDKYTIILTNNPVSYMD